MNGWDDVVAEYAMFGLIGGFCVFWIVILLGTVTRK